MPSPVMGSVAQAASPTNRARPPAAVRGVSSTRAGMGHALWGASGSAASPSTSRTWGRARISGHSRFMSRVAIPAPRWMPNPTLARPPGRGNDQA